MWVVAGYDVITFAAQAHDPLKMHFCEPTHFRADCTGESGTEEELLSDTDVLLDDFIEGMT
ncbi:hypothetical protein AV650_23020 [Serratia fonticola]|jgi:hypothetical protein|nr:hypothetical protein AV650_23020 [Serratia fonticola]ERK09287.1 hypothetical protein L581_0526 [Serratia fonticola AU-AP2C]PAA96176.1 hypothetical protein CJJ13_18065 [Serratia fonticola]